MERWFSLGEIAEALGARLRGNPETRVRGLQTLSRAAAHQVGFLANPRYRADLATTKAAAVILDQASLSECPVDALVLDNPYLGYARLSGWFDERPQPPSGIHPGAFVDGSAKIHPSARIGPGVVIEAGVEIGANVEVGPHSVIGAGSRIAEDTRLAAHVSIYHHVSIGRRVLIHSGAVLGSDGFGFANDQGRWCKIAQLGSVSIADDVEIGAGTTIDRGALGDTLIHAGVKLDNQIQIAHNVEVGENSALAGCVGVAGSSKIGRRCTLAGGVGIAGHLELADDVHVSAMGLVTKSLKTPGVYSSGTGLLPNQQWRRNVVRFRQLDQLADRLTRVEKTLQQTQQGGSESPPPYKPKG